MKKILLLLLFFGAALAQCGNCNWVEILSREEIENHFPVTELKALNFLNTGEGIIVGWGKESPFMVVNKSREWRYSAVSSNFHGPSTAYMVSPDEIYIMGRYRIYSYDGGTWEKVANVSGGFRKLQMTGSGEGFVLYNVLGNHDYFGRFDGEEIERVFLPELEGDLFYNRYLLKDFHMVSEKEGYGVWRNVLLRYGDGKWSVWKEHPSTTLWEVFAFSGEEIYFIGGGNSPNRVLKFDGKDFFDITPAVNGVSYFTSLQAVSEGHVYVRNYDWLYEFDGEEWRTINTGNSIIAYQMLSSDAGYALVSGGGLFRYSRAICGDGVTDEGEDCESCPEDAGECAELENGTACTNEIDCGPKEKCVDSACRPVKLSIGILPFNWQGSRNDFVVKAEAAVDYFLERIPLGECEDNFEVVVVPFALYGADWGGSGFCEYEEINTVNLENCRGEGAEEPRKTVEIIEACVKQYQKHKEEEFDYIVALTDRNLCSDLLAELSGMDLMGWTYGDSIVTVVEGENFGVMTHELGHKLGLEDQYCDCSGTKSAMKCSSNSLDVTNPISADEGCDPSGSCCSDSDFLIFSRPEVYDGCNKWCEGNYDQRRGDGIFSQRTVMSNKPWEGGHFSSFEYEYLKTLRYTGCDK